MLSLCLCRFYPGTRLSSHSPITSMLRSTGDSELPLDVWVTCPWCIPCFSTYVHWSFSRPRPAPLGKTHNLCVCESHSVVIMIHRMIYEIDQMIDCWVDAYAVWWASSVILEKLCEFFPFDPQQLLQKMFNRFSTILNMPISYQSQQKYFPLNLHHDPKTPLAFVFMNGKCTSNW